MKGEGWCVWVTGLPGSGKSTIAQVLRSRLEELGVRVQVLSSDMLRRVITPSPKYTEEERDVVYGALVFISAMLTQNRINVILDATANRRRYRDRARQEIPKFLEVYVRCPLSVCIQRESKRKEAVSYSPKDIYRKAQNGESANVPGMGAPYEEPINPEVIVDSDKLSPDQCAQKILKVIKDTFPARNNYTLPP